MAALARRRGHPNEEAMMCIPGLGENKTRPRKKKRQEQDQEQGKDQEKQMEWVEEQEN